MIYVHIKKRKPSLPYKLIFNDDNEITNPISIANYLNDYLVTIEEKLASFQFVIFLTLVTR